MAKKNENRKKKRENRQFVWTKIFQNRKKKRENRQFFSFPEPRKIGHLKKKYAGKKHDFENFRKIWKNGQFLAFLDPPNDGYNPVVV